jgi:hypothetical protein
VLLLYRRQHRCSLRAHAHHLQIALQTIRCAIRSCLAASVAAVRCEGGAVLHDAQITHEL